MSGLFDTEAGSYMKIAWEVKTHSPLILRCCVYFGPNFFALSESYTNCMRRIGIVPMYNDWGTLGFECERCSGNSYAIDVIKRIIYSIVHMVDEIPPKAKEEFIPIVIHNFINRKNAARLGAIAVIDAMQGPHGAVGAAGTNDVAKIIARVVWENRVFYEK